MHRFPACQRLDSARVSTVQQALPSPGWRRFSVSAAWSRYRYLLAIYALSRILFMIVAIADSLVRNVAFSRVLSNWDGHWYVRTEEIWYSHSQTFAHSYTLANHWTTLGFLPLFPMLEWLLVHTLQLGVVTSGFLLSLVLGALATILVTELAEQWWGPSAARRALVFWCFFPGTVVFSMVYTESLTITLVAGCFMLLARKRWVWAGVLAGLSTAVAPVAIAVIPACAVAAGLELREHGWRDRKALRSLIAPILSPAGLVAFGIFLWITWGTPLASYRAQHGAWQESSTPLAIPDVFGSLIHQIFINGVGRHGPGGIDLNGVLALLGTAFLFWGLWLLWKRRHTLPLMVWTWVGFVSLLALTSAKTPPNPRILICAFPVVLIVGATYEGRAQKRLMAGNLICLVVMSALTYVGIWLRP